MRNIIVLLVVSVLTIIMFNASNAETEESLWSSEDEVLLKYWSPKSKALMKKWLSPKEYKILAVGSENSYSLLRKFHKEIVKDEPDNGPSNEKFKIAATVLGTLSPASIYSNNTYSASTFNENSSSEESLRTPSQIYKEMIKLPIEETEEFNILLIKFNAAIKKNTFLLNQLKARGIYRNRIEITVGMSESRLKSKKGDPDTINRTTTKYGTDEQWVYEQQYGGDEYYYFENGVLTCIQN